MVLQQGITLVLIGSRAWSQYYDQCQYMHAIILLRSYAYIGDRVSEPTWRIGSRVLGEEKYAIEQNLSSWSIYYICMERFILSEKQANEPVSQV